MPSACLVDTRMSFPPFGGPNAFLIQLAQGLLGRGWAVSVVGQEGPDRRARAAIRDAGVRVVDDLWSPWDLPERRAARLVEWVRADPPDVFVISNCRDASWLALPGLPEEVRTVSIAHHDVSAYYGPVRHYSRYIDLAIGVSPQVRDNLAALPGVNPARCRYIPYGVDLLGEGRLAAKVAAGRSCLRLGYVGRIVQEQKRVMSLSPLLGDLAGRIPFHFSVIGEGTERAALGDAFTEAGVSDRVSFAGWLSGEALKDQLERLDVLVMVSESEGLPIAMLEAMGRGVVPIVPDVNSGMSRVVRDGENGFLVGFGDLAAYADRIVSLGEDPGRLRAMQRQSWETALGYSMGRMVNAYEGAFLELLSPGCRRPHRPRPGPFPPMESCRSRYPSWLRGIKSRVRHLYSAYSGE